MQPATWIDDLANSPTHVFTTRAPNDVTDSKMAAASMVPHSISTNVTCFQPHQLVWSSAVFLLLDPYLQVPFVATNKDCQSRYISKDRQKCQMQWRSLTTCAQGGDILLSLEFEARLQYTFT